MNHVSKHASAPSATSTEAVVLRETHPRYLHVATLPFPAPQGTQAAIHAMTAAHHRGADGAHLLTYGARFSSELLPYPCHRVGDFPSLPSFRSGPSWRKLALDARIAAKLRELHSTIRPRWVIAHHVEAAAAALSPRSHCAEGAAVSGCPASGRCTKQAPLQHGRLQHREPGYRGGVRR